MRWVLVAAVLASGPAAANDGFGGLSATGLQFGQTEAVAMEEEDLTISPDRIDVAYVFRNRTAAPVTGEVIFPLPPIPLAEVMMSEWNLPEDRGRADLVNFTARVDGRPVQVAIDRVAVIEPEWAEDRPAAFHYDTPGQDVTATLAELGLPVTADIDAVLAALRALGPGARAAAEAAGLVEIYDPGEGMAQEVWPLWSVVVRYHWTQTFPPGAAVRVEHAYDNRPHGVIFHWQDPPQEEWMQDIAARYCIDAATSRGIVRRLKPPPGEPAGTGYGTSYHIAYVLRTANSWAGPIGRFRLTLDKGSEANIVSLCAEGIRKTGPTTFVMEKRDFVPDRDLEILLVVPFPG